MSSKSAVTRSRSRTKKKNLYGKYSDCIDKKCHPLTLTKMDLYAFNKRLKIYKTKKYRDCDKSKKSEICKEDIIIDAFSKDPLIVKWYKCRIENCNKEYLKLQKSTQLTQKKHEKNEMKFLNPVEKKNYKKEMLAINNSSKRFHKKMDYAITLKKI
jgi:hypothetical protein